MPADCAVYVRSRLYVLLRIIHRDLPEQQSGRFDLGNTAVASARMNQGLKSLWSSLRAFILFWAAFFCATICNSLIPFDALKESWFFKHLITESMVDLRVKVVNAIMKGGLYDLKDVALTMVQNATMNFFGYFKEIFVLITVFHFTPLISGERSHLRHFDLNCVLYTSGHLIECTLYL